MSSIYYNKNVKPFIRELCSNWLDAYGDKRDFTLSDLDAEERNKFIMLMFELDDRQLQLHDMANVEAITTNAIIMLKTNEPEDKQVFAESWIDGAYGYYKTQMAALLEEEYQSEKELAAHERTLSYKD